MNTKSKSKKSNWLEIRKNISRCSQKDLLGLVSELYSLSKSNKDFLEARFLSDRTALERYKAQIKRYLAPDEPWKDSQRISLKDAKKPLSDYKKATGDLIGLIDLMVYYVECGTDFLRTFGDMYEQYYASLESVFSNTLEIMQQYDDIQVQGFIHRLAHVVKNGECIAWGYGDNISEMFREHYPHVEV